jgi:hyaluronan synthase
MTLPVYYYVLGTPLGVLGLIRWGCWLVRRLPAVLYKPIVNNFRLPVSVVVPVYQEDPVVFAAAIESWLANRGVVEVILVIDSTDDVCQKIAAKYPVTVVITDVPGKRDALRKGWRAARTPLVALVDSDTIWAPNVAEEVCKPFADPKIGGVGTRQSVYGTKGVLARLTDMFLDHRYFDENASQSYLGRAVSCLSGRTAVYRRQLLCEIEADFMHETFWGVPCLSGDDKRLTTLVLERGYLTYCQRTAIVWSTFPAGLKIFFKQRLRWARNTWRSDLRALSRPWVWKHPFLAYTMIDKALAGFTVLLGPVFLVHAIVLQNWLFVGVLVLWWQISRSAKMLPHIRRRPSSFFFVPAYVLLSWFMAIIKLQALLTIRQQKWGTRQVAVENGEVVRVGGAGGQGGPGGPGGPQGGPPQRGPQGRPVPQGRPGPGRPGPGPQRPAQQPQPVGAPQGPRPPYQPQPQPQQGQRPPYQGPPRPQPQPHPHPHPHPQPHPPGPRPQGQRPPHPHPQRPQQPHQGVAV